MLDPRSPADSKPCGSAHFEDTPICQVRDAASVRCKLNTPCAEHSTSLQVGWKHSTNSQQSAPAQLCKPDSREGHRHEIFITSIRRKGVPLQGNRCCACQCKPTAFWGLQPSSRNAQQMEGWRPQTAVGRPLTCTAPAKNLQRGQLLAATSGAYFPREHKPR